MFAATEVVIFKFMLMYSFLLYLDIYFLLTIMFVCWISQGRFL